MLQCAQCELADVRPNGEIRLRCNPFEDIKEPECLQKWQLMKLEGLFRSYQATLAQYRRLAPLQERMMKFMEREMDDIDEADKWKADWDEEDDTDSEDEGEFGLGPPTY